MPEDAVIETSAGGISMRVPESSQRQSTQRTKVVVKIRDQWLKLAVTALLESSGYHVMSVDHEEALIVTDDEAIQGQDVVRLVEDRSGPSKEAFDALIEARVGALVSKRDPAYLPIALQAIEHGMLVAPHHIIDSAQAIPAISTRQAKILNLIGAGLSNRQIAIRLSVSDAIIKREVSSLLRIFDTNSRVNLAMRSAEIGYRPRNR